MGWWLLQLLVQILAFLQLTTGALANGQFLSVTDNRNVKNSFPYCFKSRLRSSDHAESHLGPLVSNRGTF